MSNCSCAACTAQRFCAGVRIIPILPSSDVDVERLIGNDSFEPPVFVFERLDFCDVANFQAAELCFPTVERRRAYPMFAAEFFSLPSRLHVL